MKRKFILSLMLLVLVSSNIVVPCVHCVWQQCRGLHFLDMQSPDIRLYLRNR